MTLHPPRYSLPPPDLRPHADRVRVVFWAAVRERLGVLNIVLLALIYIAVLLQIIVPFYLGSLAPGLAGMSANRFLYLPYSTQVWFFFEALFTASIGAGVIANDVTTRSLTMYLARPITHLDYLTAKFSAIALWLGIAIIAPALIGTIIILALGYVSLGVALGAAAAYLGIGLLTVLAFAGLAVLLSAYAPRSAYAAGAIFGILIGAEVIAAVLSGISGSSTIVYVSLGEDVLAVAQYAFGISGGVLDPLAAGLLLALVGTVGVALTYRKLATIDAVAE